MGHVGWVARAPPARTRLTSSHTTSPFPSQSPSAPVIEFHGDKDTTIPIEHAKAVEAAYKKTGVPYKLVVLEGCAHAAWCWGCGNQCSCPNGTAGYCPAMDTMALPFIAEHLNLTLVE